MGLFFMHNQPPIEDFIILTLSSTTLLTWNGVDTNTSANYTMRYGDGTQEVFTSGISSGGSHIYSSAYVGDVYILGGGIRFINTTDSDISAVDFTNAPELDLIAMNTAGTISSIDLSNNPLLTTISMNGQDLSSVDLSNNSLLTSVGFAANLLTQSAIDNILVTLDTHGLSNGVCSIGGLGNSAPSSTGLTAKSNLEGKGWTVSTN